MSRKSPGDALLRLPPDLPQSTVSEIASWLVGQPLDAVERELIRQTLEACGGDRALAASILGLSLPGLRKKITAYAVRGQALPGAETNTNETRGKAPKTIEARRVLSAPKDEAGGAPFAREGATTIAATETPAESKTIAPMVEIAPHLRASVSEAPQRVELSLADQVAAPPSARPELVHSAPPAANDLEPLAANDPLPTSSSFDAAREGTPASPMAARGAPRSYRLPLAAVLAALLAAPIAYGLFFKGERDTSAPISLDRVELNVSVREQPLPLEQRIAVPAWVMPAERPAQAAQQQAQTPPVAAQTSAEPPAPEPTPSAAPAIPSTAPAIPSTAPTPPAVARDNDLRRIPAPADIALDTRMELGAPDSAKDAAMPLSPADVTQDVAMALGAPNLERDVAMPLGAADSAADTRMEPGDWQAALAAQRAAPETTGSIPPATFFKAPETVPMPVERGDPGERPARRPAPRAAAPTPPQPVPPDPATLIKPLFPFNLFERRDERAGNLPPPATPPGVCCGSR